MKTHTPIKYVARTEAGRVVQQQIIPLRGKDLVNRIKILSTSSPLEPYDEIEQ